ncbi:MAG: Gfo/Idh/MocA family oxidoreductase [Planctomycetes bacterium]|nr:Gfo/Idh/MocA family oxidoreductase [Planctomycetota bacterium]
MRDERLSIGIVGLGRFIEIAHMPCYYASPYADRIRVAAICDLDAGRLAEIGDRHGIAGRFTDAREMLRRADLDAVVVATPDHAHTAIAMAAIEAGKHVLVEKPLAMSTAECRGLADAARRHRVRLVTDFHKRFDPAHQDARDRIRDGQVGELQMGIAWMQDVISVPAGGFFRSDLAARSSPNWFLGVHFYDLLRFLTELEPAEVRATGYRQVLPARGIDTYDAIKADVVMASGASVSFNLSWNLPDAAPILTRQGIYLQFTCGDIDINSSERGYAVTTNERYRFVNPLFLRKTERGLLGYGIESIGEHLMEFRTLGGPEGDARYDALERERPSGLDGLWATAMAEAVDRSLARGTARAEGAVRVGAVVDLRAEFADALPGRS